MVEGSTSARETPPRVTCALAKPCVPVTTSGNAGKRAAKRLLFGFRKGFGGHIRRKTRFPNDRLRQQARQNAGRQRQQDAGAS